MEQGLKVSFEMAPPNPLPSNQNDSLLPKQWPHSSGWVYTKKQKAAHSGCFWLGARLSRAVDGCGREGTIG